MGAWAFDIMGGDSPLDCLGTIEDFLGIDQENSMYAMQTPNKEIADLLSSKQLEVIAEFKEADYDSEHYGLVFGFYMMNHGAKMLPPTKVWIMQCCDKDEWSQESHERKAEIEKFRRQIEEYNDMAISIKTTGLFDTIAQHIIDGKTGLVNK